MPVVTVQSAHATTVSLSYDSGANALLATYVRNAISTGIAGTSIVPFAGNTGPTPPLATGKTGEWVQTTPGAIVLGPGWDYIVAPDTAAAANITGPSDPNVAMIAGGGNLIFNAAEGSGSVIAGGGNNSVTIPLANTGGWFVGMGNGSDTVRALGSGNDTIRVGTGADSIQLGAGSTAVTTGGAATVTASSGSETITAYGSDVVYGFGSNLSFIGTGGATVVGGTGSDTVTGGTGPDSLQGGSAGDNVLTAGIGAATLFGGGNGDQLFANGPGAQILFAASGNETLTGSPVSGGNDTFAGGTGNATIVANPSDTNLFEFSNATPGGTDIVQGLSLTSQVSIHLAGYDFSVESTALSGQTHPGGSSTTIGLGDGTTITFQNVATLTTGNFV